MAVNDVHLATLSGCIPRVTPSQPLASHGASYQQDFFDAYSPLSHSTASRSGSANDHLSFAPSFTSTSFLSMPSHTDISLPINAMTNAGSTYPNNCALIQMSIPPANMASAGIAATGMTTPISTLTSSQMATHPNEMWRYPFANQPSQAGPRRTSPHHSHNTGAVSTFMTHQGFPWEFPQSATGDPNPLSLYQVPAQQMAGMPNNNVRGDGRKCRKVYRMENKDKWCTQCRWKKACARFPDY